MGGGVGVVGSPPAAPAHGGGWGGGGGVGGSYYGGSYGGGCGGLVAPTMAAVTVVVVVGWWLRRCRPLRRWLWGVGDSDGAASRVKTLTYPAVDGDVVLEELTSAVATTVCVRFTFKLSSGFLGA